MLSASFAPDHGLRNLWETRARLLVNIRCREQRIERIGERIACYPAPARPLSESVQEQEEARLASEKEELAAVRRQIDECLEERYVGASLC